MKKLLLLAVVALAGCSPQMHEPSVRVQVDHLGENDGMEITIKYSGSKEVVAELNGQMLPVVGPGD